MCCLARSLNLNFNFFFKYFPQFNFNLPSQSLFSSIRYYFKKNILSYELLINFFFLWGFDFGLTELLLHDNPTLESNIEVTAKQTRIKLDNLNVLCIY